MGKENHILLAYEFKGDGTAFTLKSKEVAVEVKSEQLTWVHLDVNNPKTGTWLKKKVSYLDHIIIEALLAEETRPRLVKFAEGYLIILRCVNVTGNYRSEEMPSIRLWIDSHRIISLQRRNIDVINYIENEIKNNNAPKTAGDFFTVLCNALSDRLQIVLEDLEDRVAEIEEKVLEKHDINLREEIIKIRKQAIVFRRYLSPQKEVINILRSSTQAWLNDMDRRVLQENYDHFIRYVEDLDEIRERSQIIQDELTNSINEKLNKNMYVLSVISSIFLPLTTITGLFGVNLRGIPFASNPYGFYVLLLFLLGVVGFQIRYFKRSKWF